MIRSSINSQFSEHISAQDIVWEHPFDRFLQDPLGLLLDESLVRNRFQPAGVACMPIVLFLLCFISGDSYLLCVYDYDVIAHICMRRIDRFVLSL